jgi:acyl carrier protein
MGMSNEEVYSQVREVLVDALGVDDDEVTPGAKVMADLGAESIDVLDIAFRLEKQFSIKIPRGELMPAEEILNNAEFVEGGKLTAKGLAKVREVMPHANLTEFEKDPQIDNMTDLFTVDLIVKYVERKLSAA